MKIAGFFLFVGVLVPMTVDKIRENSIKNKFESSPQDFAIIKIEDIHSKKILKCKTFNDKMHCFQ